MAAKPPTTFLQMPEYAFPKEKGAQGLHAVNPENSGDIRDALVVGIQ